MDSDLPDFDQLWNYDRPAETEQKFRQLSTPARESGSTSYQAQLLTQIARTHSLRGSFAEAHRLLDEAHGLLNGKTVAAHLRYLLERGRTFNSAGEADQARRLFREAWEMARAAGEDFFAVDAAHMLGIAEPPPHFARAYDLLSQDSGVAAAEPARLKRLGQAAEKA